MDLRIPETIHLNPIATEAFELGKRKTAAEHGSKVALGGVPGSS
jgi:hypothetical protein